MKKILIVQTMVFYIVIVGSNLLVEWADAGNIQRFLARPWLFFGGGLLGSILGAYIVYQIDQHAQKRKKGKS